MIEQNLPVLVPLILLVGALSTALLGSWKPGFAYPITLSSVVVALAVAVSGLKQTMTAGTVRYPLAGWVAPIGIEYVLDPLSAFMLLVVLTVSVLVLVHARTSVQAELPGKSVSFYTVTLLLLTGFSGIVLAGDLFNLYVFLEISSLAGYALIAVGEKPSPVAAFRYLLVGTIGASFYLLGVGFIYSMTGSLNVADVAKILPTVGAEPPVIAGLILMVAGLLIKMALFPLHGWLPDAYTYAPSTASALIAPIGTKVGAYVLLRILFFLFEPDVVRNSFPVADIILWLSLAGILFGSIMAMAQNELKRMLAYSSVAQIGYIGMGIGLANPLGFVGAVLHVLNHAFMKGGLFLVAGNLRLQIGHSSISKFDDSLRKTMPWTMAAFTLFSLSMIGIPPTAGFFSKWYLVLAGFEESNWAAITVILLSSLLNAVYFFRVLEKVYLKSNTNEKADEEGSVLRNDARLSMLVPTLLLAVGLLVLGVFNVVIVTEVIALMIPSGL